MKIYSDKVLSQQLERTEARFNAEFVSSRAKMFPGSGVEWREIDGTYALFDGAHSPLTQTFGLGLFEKITEKTLHELEKFYQRFEAPVFHEVSPMSDSAHMDILNQCGYRLSELTSILYKPLSKEESFINPEITTEQLQRGEESLWASINAKGWSTEAPGLFEFIYEFAQIAIQAQGVRSFFANLNGKPIATGMLFIENGMALLAGDSTIAEGRNRGAQKALVDARLRYAETLGCTIAMMAASPGSQSQKNGEKNGFRLAYTRSKWKKN